MVLMGVVLFVLLVALMVLVVLGFDVLPWYGALTS